MRDRKIIKYIRKLFSGYINGKKEVKTISKNFVSVLDDLRLNLLDNLTRNLISTEISPKYLCTKLLKLS